MIGSVLLSAVLAGSFAGEGPDPGALIERLVAENLDDRVAAFKALEKLGAEALPALRAAADSSDPWIRSRVLALVESAVRQVATERVTRPTLVRLDFRERPLLEVVRALNDRHDFRLAVQLAPENRGMMVIDDPDEPKRLARLREGRITLETSAPVPFWEVMDRLCKAAALRYHVPRPRGSELSRGPIVLLADRSGRGPVFDSGPFRVQITRDHPVFPHDFDIADPELGGRGAKAAGRGTLTVPLAVLTQPGLVLHQNGPVTIEEAVDDWGRALAARPPEPPDPRPANRHSLGPGSPASIEVDVQLVAPTLPPVTAIRRLRGKVPVIVVSRRSDPLVIPLNGDGAVGKRYWTREMTITVDEVSLAPRTEVSLRVIRPADSRYVHAGEAIDAGTPDFTSFNGERVTEHMELYDAAGRRLNHVRSAPGGWVDGNEWYARYSMFVVPGFEDGASLERLREPRAPWSLVPTELRYYGFVQTATDVPLDFRDIPMP